MTIIAETGRKWPISDHFKWAFPSENGHDITTGEWTEACDKVSEPMGGWLGLWDCLKRTLLSTLLFYWCLLTSPGRLFQYTVHYNKLWYGTVSGLVVTAFLPVEPFCLLIVEILTVLKRAVSTGEEWYMGGAGKVFFIGPANPLTRLVWQWYIRLSGYISQFLLCGNNRHAINHTFDDVILVKDFWRSALVSSGARVPPELARWTGKELVLKKSCHEEKKWSDLAVKLTDSYVGIGDSFWRFGKDFTTTKDLEELLRKNYDKKEALVLKFIRPLESLGVHSLDIITMRTPDGCIKILSVILWTDCHSSSSHSTQAGYVVDARTGRVRSSARWYCAAIANMEHAPLVGSEFPLVKEACEQAIAAHRAIQHDWLVAVGWDAMVDETGKVVFFEGNFAGMRTSRRFFLSLGALQAAVSGYFWPFGRDSSVQP